MRRKRFIAMSDGINEVTGEDWPDPDTDGQVVPFFEKGEHVITRQMLIDSGVRVESLATNPRDAWINVAMHMINILKADSDGQLQKFDVVELDRLVSIMSVCVDCVRDRDFATLQHVLRERGFLQRVSQ